MILIIKKKMKSIKILIKTLRHFAILSLWIQHYKINVLIYMLATLVRQFNGNYRFNYRFMIKTDKNSHLICLDTSTYKQNQILSYKEWNELKDHTSYCSCKHLFYCLVFTSVTKIRKKISGFTVFTYIRHY